MSKNSYYGFYLRWKPVIMFVIFGMSFITNPLKAQNFDPAFTGPYEIVSGRFFVRTYLVYIETATDPWATNLGQSELERRTARSFELLNTAFNQFDIYFVPGEVSGECYTIYEGGDPLPQYSDGLTAHIHSDDNQSVPYVTGGTNGNTVPARVFWVRGMESNIPGSNLPVLIHEVGHCLGLAHTFDFTDSNNIYANNSWCSAGSCISDPTNDPDHCCGDFVDDTPRHGISTFIEIDSSCCCSIIPFKCRYGYFRKLYDL